MKISILGALILLLSGCNNAPQNTTEEHEHHQPESQSKVELNKGQKWQANPETTTGINNMLELIQDFDKENGDYAQLQKSLQKEFKMIFQKCTMTGEAHDQLHNYLLPLKEKIDDLSQENIKEVSHYLKTYSDYFK